MDNVMGDVYDVHMTQTQAPNKFQVLLARAAAKGLTIEMHESLSAMGHAGAIISRPGERVGGKERLHVFFTSGPRGGSLRAYRWLPTGCPGRGHVQRVPLCEARLIMKTWSVELGG